MLEDLCDIQKPELERDFTVTWAECMTNHNIVITVSLCSLSS